MLPVKLGMLAAAFFLPSCLAAQTVPSLQSLAPEYLNHLYDGSKVNPMLTDRHFRPHVERVDAGKNIETERVKEKDDGVRWNVEVFGGGSVGLPNQINVNTRGGRPPYISARVGRWQHGAAWEFEGINSYQRPENSGIDNDILRGATYFLVNRAYEVWGLIWRVGAGVVVTHPSPTAEEEARHSSGSYYLAGLASQASVAKRLYISDHAFTSLEGKINGDFPKARNPDNTINPPAVSANAVLGIGLDF